MKNMTNEWDKCYPKNENVNHKKVSFKNHFGIELVADFFSPKKFNLLVCHLREVKIFHYSFFTLSNSIQTKNGKNDKGDLSILSLSFPMLNLSYIFT